jgi:hypothetical protein
MKRILLPIVGCAVFLGCWAILLGWAGVSPLAAADPSRPVYIFLSSTVDDHINTDISEDRIRRMVGMLEKVRAQAPSAGINATLLFSGAMSEQLEKQNGDQLLDFIKASRNSGLLHAGYDGSNEPSSVRHPLMDFTGATNAEDRWSRRLASADQVLTAARDPLTGALLPNGSGGLKKMQEVFGPASYIRGVFLVLHNSLGPMVEVGSDTEIVHALERLNTNAVMEGIADSSPAHAGSSNYRGWVAALSTVLGADPDSSPELFWQDGRLRSSEDGKSDLRLFRASAGVVSLKKALAGMDRSRIRILHIQIANQTNHAKPMPTHARPDVPLTYAYLHPEQPKYPAELRHSKAETDAAYANEEAVLHYLAAEFFPANPGSRFVSSEDLKRMTPPAWGYDLGTDKLRAAVQEMLAAWGDAPQPPKFLRVEGHFLSEADLFGVLADALAQMNRTGSLPATVRVPHIFGPIRTAQPQPPVLGEATVASVAQTCTRLADESHHESWTPIPRNAVPSEVVVGGLVVSPSQFLRLMAEALVASAAETRLTIKPTEMFWGRPAVFYRRRPLTEIGSSWTFKPAPIRAEDSAAGR